MFQNRKNGFEKIYVESGFHSNIHNSIFHQQSQTDRPDQQKIDWRILDRKPTGQLVFRTSFCYGRKLSTPGDKFSKHSILRHSIFPQHSCICSPGGHSRENPGLQLTLGKQTSCSARKPKCTERFSNHSIFCQALRSSVKTRLSANECEFLASSLVLKFR